MQMASSGNWEMPSVYALLLGVLLILAIAFDTVPLLQYPGIG